LTILLASIIFFSLGTYPTEAISEFSSQQNIIYDVGSRGEARAEQEIQLTNNMSTIYPKEFVLSLSESISSLSAWDELGDILVSHEQIGEITKINLKFNKKIVGKDKTLTFHLRYNIPKFAIKKGQAWEIIVPRPKNTSSFEKYQATILVPRSFNNLAYASVTPNTTVVQGNKRKIIFKKEKFAQGPIIVAFANFQVFRFSLQYYLENNKYEKALIKIPLPPETNYQEVLFSKIEPVPEKVSIDTDGNWMAEYILSKGEKAVVTTKGEAKIFSKPQLKPFYNQANNLSLFLKATNYWPTQNRKIIKIAKQNKTIKEIYQYAVQTLDYDHKRANDGPKRMGALGAINYPEQAVCTEFTDLFITLARANGIPAREIEGYANSNDPKIKPTGLSTNQSNKTILHAWPEYWDTQQKTWIQVDPTWEKTTGGVDYFSSLDLNHFALVIHGETDNQPPPPSSYGHPGYQPKISIEVADKFTPPKPTEPKFGIIPRLKMSKQNLFLHETEAVEVSIKNGTIATVKNANIQISFLGSDKRPLWKKQIYIIPPFGQLTATISHPPLKDILLASGFFAKIEANGQQYIIKSPLGLTEKLTIIQPYLVIALLSLFTLLLMVVIFKKAKGFLKN